MMSNAYLLANFGFDTAENEPAKNLQILEKSCQFCYAVEVHIRGFQAVPLGLREVPAGHPHAVGRVEAAGLWS